MMYTIQQTYYIRFRESPEVECSFHKETYMSHEAIKLEKKTNSIELDRKLFQFYATSDFDFLGEKDQLLFSNTWGVMLNDVVSIRITTRVVNNHGDLIWSNLEKNAWT